MIFSKKYKVIRIVVLACILIVAQAKIIKHNEPIILEHLRNLPSKELSETYGWKIARIFKRYKKLQKYENESKEYIAVFGGSTTDQNIRGLKDSEIREIVGTSVLNLSLQSQTWPEMIRILDSIKSENAKIVFSYFPWIMFKNPISAFTTHSVSYGKERPHLFESSSLQLFYGNSIPKRVPKLVDRIFPPLSPPATHLRLKLNQLTVNMLTPLKKSLSLNKDKREKGSLDLRRKIDERWKTVEKKYQRNIDRNIKVLSQIIDICKHRGIPFAIVRLPFNKITYEVMKPGIDLANEELSQLIRKKNVPHLSLKPHPFFEDPTLFIDHAHYSSAGKQQLKKKILKSYSRVFNNQ